MDTVAGLRTDQHEWGEVHYYEHDLPTCAQEISENDVDAAHFQYLHGMPAMNEAEATTDGPLKRTVQTFLTSENSTQGEVASATEYLTIRDSQGPGITSVWAKTRSRLRLFRDSEVPKCLRGPNWTVRSLPAIERLGSDFEYRREGLSDGGVLWAERNRPIPTRRPISR